MACGWIVEDHELAFLAAFFVPTSPTGLAVWAILSLYPGLGPVRSFALSVVGDDAPAILVPSDPSGSKLDELYDGLPVPVSSLRSRYRRRRRTHCVVPRASGRWRSAVRSGRSLHDRIYRRSRFHPRSSAYGRHSVTVTLTFRQGNGKVTAAPHYWQHCPHLYRSESPSQHGLFMCLRTESQDPSSESSESASHIS